MPERNKPGGKRQRHRSPRAAASAAWVAALRKGEEDARFILEQRSQRASRRTVGVRRGVLLAEGDSWFDYPFFDVLEKLEEAPHNYIVESVAHRGDTLEEMVYDPNQLEKLAGKMERLRDDGQTPLAILLSGGGNDIAGEEFAVLLNHKASGLPALNDRIVAGLFEDRLRMAVVELSSAVTQLCVQTYDRKLPILLHGYDYPVPDGRGYLGGFWRFPGPWLEPGFRRKGYEDLGERSVVMQELIERWNAVIEGIAGGPGLEHLRYVNLRGTLSNDLKKDAYKTWWGNELHPTERGFRRVADAFYRVLSSL